MVFAERNLSPSDIYPHWPRFLMKVEAVTAPLPLFGGLHQSPFDRIALHVSQLLHAFACRKNIKVVESRLPKSPMREIRRKQTELAAGCPPLAPWQQGVCRALFQHLHHGGKSSDLGFGQKQVECVLQHSPKARRFGRATERDPDGIEAKH
jgi:hypothetical protein